MKRFEEEWTATSKKGEEGELLKKELSDEAYALGMMLQGIMDMLRTQAVNR